MMLVAGEAQRIARHPLFSDLDGVGGLVVVEMSILSI
jgi:hypothetical protein